MRLDPGISCKVFKVDFYTLKDILVKFICRQFRSTDTMYKCKLFRKNNTSTVFRKVQNKSIAPPPRIFCKIINFKIFFKMIVVYLCLRWPKPCEPID